MKQCEHCRGARKAKSHHAKCDCGDKKDKIAKANLNGDIFGELDADGVRLAMDEHTCVCYKGTKCTCGAIKREYPDPALPSHTHTTNSRPKLTSAQSETSLMTVTNGQHRPCHRLNNAAHTSGAPYRIPRQFHPQNRPGHSRTISIDTAQPSRGLAAPFGALANSTSYNGLPIPRQGTVDDMHLLGSSMTDFYGNSSQRSVDNLSSLFSLPFDQFSNVTSAPTSIPTSAPNMPYLGGPSFAQSVPSDINNFTGNRNQTSWVPYSVSQVTPNTYNGDNLISSPTSDWGPLNDVDWGSYAGLNTPFSAVDLPLNSNKLSNPLMQPPPSNSGESFQLSACGNTVSSGPRSEAGEFGFLNDLGPEWPQLDQVSTNASATNSLYDLSSAAEWPARSPSSGSDPEQDIEFYRSDTIKPPKSQAQPISLTIPSSVSPPIQYIDTPSQYASAAASGQASPVVFGEVWESQPASATSYTFPASISVAEKADIDPQSLTTSLEQVQEYDQNFNWDAVLNGDGTGIYDPLQGLGLTTVPNPTSTPMTSEQANMWLSNHQ